MKEIGGYFPLEELVKKEFYPALIPLNSGRNAFLFLLRTLNYRKAYLPFYLCDSIAQTCRNEGVEIEFYNIGKNMLPILAKQLQDREVLLVVNYYGQLTDEMVKKLKNKYKNIILDNTQAFFQRPIKGVDTIYSCRKFFGVPDGAYLATASVGEALLPDKSKDRMLALLGRFEGAASTYYEAFKTAEASIDDMPLMAMSKLTNNLLGAVDYERVRKKRIANFNSLQNGLKKYNKISVSTPDGPFAYPFYSENGMQVRKKLAKKNIFIPTLWPNVVKSMSEDTIEFKYASNILPLPCDQRYEHEDMESLISHVLLESSAE